MLRRKRHALLFTGLAVILAACGPRPVQQTVNLYDYFFDPPTIDVPAGAQVTLTVVNRAHHEHVWAVMELGYQLALPFDPKDSDRVLHSVLVDVEGRETLTFTAPDETGEYAVLCTIPGHADQGMVGTLKVK
jgi:plastocyanin